MDVVSMFAHNGVVAIAAVVVGTALASHTIVAGDNTFCVTPGVAIDCVVHEHTRAAHKMSMHAPT